MGLRGLTVLFASGDDGIGGHLVKTDPVVCVYRHNNRHNCNAYTH
jgi:hypothetical protein